MKTFIPKILSEFQVEAESRNIMESTEAFFIEDDNSEFPASFDARSIRVQLLENGDAEPKIRFGFGESNDYQAMERYISKLKTNSEDVGSLGFVLTPKTHRRFYRLIEDCKNCVLDSGNVFADQEFFLTFDCEDHPEEGMVFYPGRTYVKGAMDDANPTRILHANRRILCAEILFLSENLDPNQRYEVWMTGDERSFHVPFLARLFPNCFFRLIDPEARIRPSKNLRIEKRRFTMADARQMRQRHNVIFMCDVNPENIDTLRNNLRKSPKSDEQPLRDFEDAIKASILEQAEWVREARPLFSMLKFRLSKFDKTMPYFPGKLMVQPWIKRYSTELRLVVSRNDIDREVMYDAKQISDTTFYYNTVVRELNYCVSESLPSYSLPHDLAWELAAFNIYLEKFRPDVVERTPTELERLGALRQCSRELEECLRVTHGTGFYKDEKWCFPE